MLDVHQLRVFAAVAENLSFTRAAERLFLTQSAVSHQIARLEREIGCPLLERQGSSLTVALHSGRAGKWPYPARARLRRGRGSRMSPRAPRGAGPTSDVSASASSSTACQYIIPEALREFRECFPGYSLAITPGDSPQTAERLINGEIDLALMVRLDRQKKLAYHDLFDDELKFIVSPLHPWAEGGRKGRSPGNWPNNTWCSTAAIVRRSAWWRDTSFGNCTSCCGDWIELGDMGAIKELVKLGLGVSITAHWTARPEVAEKSLVLLPVPGSRLHRSWCIATAAGRELSMAEQTFIGLCQSVYARSWWV